MIKLWELRGKNDCRYSTFSWRARLELLHKGVPFETHPVAASDKDSIRFSGQEKVPIIRDDGRVISDSWKIACYLEAEYPDRPTLFGGQPGQNLNYFMNLWADRELVASLVPPLMLDVLDCVDECDAFHRRTQMETIFKEKLEDLYVERTESLDQFRKRLAPMKRILSASPFLAGDAPAYADYILFGTLQWARVVSTEQVLEEDDIVSSWFERILDLYGGAGRQEPSRHDRNREQPA